MFHGKFFLSNTDREKLLKTVEGIYENFQGQVHVQLDDILKSAAPLCVQVLSAFAEEGENTAHDTRKAMAKISRHLESYIGELLVNQVVAEEACASLPSVTPADFPNIVYLGHQDVLVQWPDRIDARNLLSELEDLWALLLGPGLTPIPRLATRFYMAGVFIEFKQDHVDIRSERPLAHVQKHKHHPFNAFSSALWDLDFDQQSTGGAVFDEDRDEIRFAMGQVGRSAANHEEDGFGPNAELVKRLIAA